MKIEFSRNILEQHSISDFMKIRPVGSELFHADRVTYTFIMEVIVAFRNFENTSKNTSLRHHHAIALFNF